MANYTFYVTVSGGKFVIDGVSQQTVDLGHDLTYRFDQSDSSNGSGSGHPLRFSTTSDGTHNSGSEYTTGVTTNGTPGQSGAYTEIAVTSSTTNPLYYYCSNHSGMGGQANTTSAEFANTTGVALKKPILANATDKWGHYINQNLDTIAGKLPQSFVFPTGTGANNQVILSDGSGGTSWGDVALTPEIQGVTWYSDSGYSNTLSASEAINIDDATYLKVTGQNFGSSGVFGNNAYVQIINTTQSNAVVGNNQSGLTGCVTSASYQSEAEVRFTINPNGLSNISSGDTLKVKFITSGGESLFATGYVVSADPTSVTTVNSATISNTASVGSFGGTVAGGGDDSNTKLLLNFDRTGGTDIEDSSNTGGDGHKITASGNAIIKASPFGDGKSAMYFDGSNDYLEIPDSSDFDFGAPNGNTNDFTIELWFYALSLTGDRVFIARNDHDGTDSEWWIRNDDTYYDYYRPKDSHGQVANSVFETNKWTHLAVVREQTNVKVFVDGKLVSSVSNSDSWEADSGSGIGHRLVIGARHTGSSYAQFFSGYMDEIRIVKGSAVYTGDFDVPTSRLTAITNTKLLIHSDLGDGGIFFGRATKKTITVTKNSGTTFGTNNEPQNLVSGVISGSGENFHFTATDATNTGYFEFECDNSKSIVVNGFRWFQSNSDNHGTWVLEASNDNFTTTATLKSAFTLGGGTEQTFNTDSTNTTAYKKFRLRKTGGTTSGSPYINEIEFFNNTFTDSATSGTTHIITATGAYHSQGHGGIAPALTFPASQKKTGSAGIYFDGDGDYVTIHNSSADLMLTSGDHTRTIDFWFYRLKNDDNDGFLVSSGADSSNRWQIWASSDNKVGLFIIISGSTKVPAMYTTDAYNLNEWNHFALTKSSGVFRLYLNGKYQGKSSANTDVWSTNGNVILGVNPYSTSTDNFKGYIDSLRFRTDAVTTSENTTNWSNGYSQPTQIYGAFKPDTIDTVTLTGSVGSGQSGYVTFNNATLSGNTETTSALPAGLTLNEAESQDNTATITGDLTADVGSHVINLVARVTSDGTDAEIDPNRKQAYSHTITKASGGAPVLFNARRYHGTGVNSARDINGFGLQPDLVWIKNRDDASFGHALVDSVRGHSAFLSTDSNSAPTSNSNVASQFNADGFSTGSSFSGYSNGDKAYIAWAWKAGGAPSSSALSLSGGVGAGTIANDATGVSGVTSITQSVNQNSGFSITKFSGSSITSGYTSFPHNLGGTPSLIIQKRFSGAYGDDWHVWHTSNAQSDGAGNGPLRLNDSGTQVSGIYGYFSATNTEIRLNSGSNNANNLSNTGYDYICYAWKAVSEVSAFGSYTGQQSGTITESSDTYCGFKPSFVMIKCISHASWWVMFDKFRLKDNAPANQLDPYLGANSESPDYDPSGYSNAHITLTDNGFTTGTDNNIGGSGRDYIWMAFA